MEEVNDCYRELLAVGLILERATSVESVVSFGIGLPSIAVMK